MIYLERSACLEWPLADLDNVNFSLQSPLQADKVLKKTGGLPNGYHGEQPASISMAKQATHRMALDVLPKLGLSPSHFPQFWKFPH